MQHFDPAVAVVQEGAAEHTAVVFRFDRSEHRDVAGALYHRHHQPAPRFSDVLVGYVLSNPMGLGGVIWNDRLFPDADDSVRAAVAGYFDLRGARGAASPGAELGEWIVAWRLR